MRCSNCSHIFDNFVVLTFNNVGRLCFTNQIPVYSSWEAAAGPKLSQALFLVVVKLQKCDRYQEDF